MNSTLFSLNWRDAGKGLTVAILAAIFTWLAAVFNTPGFELASLDWAELMRIATAAGMSYIVKNFISDREGKILGRV